MHCLPWNLSINALTKYSGGIARVRQTNAKASGGECIDVEVLHIGPWSRVVEVFPRTHAVRFVERVPCEPVAVVSLKYETLEKLRLTIPESQSEVADS